MNPLISVIVPIYKVESYLKRCVDSILEQTYKNLEIILVDDGSPDNCGKICDEYALNDSRIKVIHKTNGGLSDARNTGMSISTGEYLSFVDSDDWLPPDSIQYLYDLLCEYDAQVSIGGRNRVNFDGSSILHSDYNGTTELHIMNKIEAMQFALSNGCYSWGRLYKREVHIDIPFPVGEIFEDVAVILHVLDKCVRIIQSNHIVYNYRYRPDSILTKSFSLKQTDWVHHTHSNLQFVQQYYPELEILAATRYRECLMWAIRKIMLSDLNYKKECSQFVRALREHHPLFLSTPFLNKRDKIRYRLLVHFPPEIYKFVLCIRHSKRQNISFVNQSF